MDDLSIAFKLNDQVITFWQFYVGWNAGIVGWVFSRDAAWSHQKSIAIGISVLIFNVFNISGLYRTTSSLSSVINSMKASEYQISDGVSVEVFWVTIERLSTGDWYLHIGPHLIADAIVAYLIFVMARRTPQVSN